ncbi:MAG TPA: Spy/CpxP family protein refolding chaperone [Coleofasciculaceae cyanobacterium]|jgi:Spy/CpxP family protein refolding chaperone
MLWRRLSIFSILLLCLGGAVVLANQNPLFPQTPMQSLGEPRRGASRQLKLMEQLNLTQEQKQKLQAIHSQYKEQISQSKQSLHQATEELKKLMAGNASAGEIRTKHQEVRRLRDQLEEVSFESMLAMREVLTPDQRSQFAQLMEHRRTNFNSPMRNQRGSES